MSLIDKAIGYLPKLSVGLSGIIVFKLIVGVVKHPATVTVIGEFGPLPTRT